MGALSLQETGNTHFSNNVKNNNKKRRGKRKKQAEFQNDITVETIRKRFLAINPKFQTVQSIVI
jgi:hypothetical protein